MKRFLLLAFLLAAHAQAATIVLAWDARPAGEQITSYNVYTVTPRGARGSASWDLWGNVPDTTATIMGLIPGSMHVWAVTALSNFGESLRSAPLPYRTP